MVIKVETYLYCHIGISGVRLKAKEKVDHKDPIKQKYEEDTMMKKPFGSYGSRNGKPLWRSETDRSN